MMPVPAQCGPESLHPLRPGPSGCGTRIKRARDPAQDNLAMQVTAAQAGSAFAPGVPAVSNPPPPQGLSPGPPLPLFKLRTQKKGLAATFAAILVGASAPSGTGLRGFVASADEALLEPLKQGRQDFAGHCATAKSLTAGPAARCR